LLHPSTKKPVFPKTPEHITTVYQYTEKEFLPLNRKTPYVLTGVENHKSYLALSVLTPDQKRAVKRRIDFALEKLSAKDSKEISEITGADGTIIHQFGLHDYTAGIHKPENMAYTLGQAFTHFRASGQPRETLFFARQPDSPAFEEKKMAIVNALIEKRHATMFKLVQRTIHEELKKA
jgi:hypothetical protein